MTIKTLTHSTTQQTSGGKYQTFSNLNNIKTKDNTYAECHVGGKSDTLNRPSTLTLTNYKANLPEGALVTKVTVKLKQSKAKVNNKDCNVQAPTVSLIEGSTVYTFSDGSAMSKKAQAPTSTATESSVSFGMSKNWYLLNRQNFGVKIDYPANANDNEGLIRLYYVQIEITYRTSSYGISIEQRTGEYNGDTYIIAVGISNTNLTSYDPTITLSAPEGFSLINHDEGPGTFTQVNSRVATFQAEFSPDSSYNQVWVEYSTNITYASGVETYTGTFTAVENLNSTGSSKTLTVKKTRPSEPSVDPPAPDSDLSSEGDSILNATPSIELKAKPLRPFILEIDLGNYATTQFPFIYLESDTTGVDVLIPDGSWLDWDDEDYEDGEVLTTLTASTPYQLTYENQYIEDGKLYLFFGMENYNKANISVIIPHPMDSGNLYENLISIETVPDITSTPALSILRLTQEELNRLGHTYTYTVQSIFKEVTNDSYVRNWGQNFKIGVFNNAITENITVTEETDEETGEVYDIITDSTDYDSLTPTELFENAEYWSSQPENPNTYESISCEFPYNKDYPVFIIITGDYQEATTMASVTFTEPCIIESETFSKRESNGVYPIPVNDLILNDGSSASLNLDSLSSASPLIFYDFPFPEDYGENTQIAIRGLELKGTIHSNTDNLVLLATLKNSKNESRQRSIVLDQQDYTDLDNNQFSIGGVGDLWGFTTLDVTNLSGWESHLQPSNSLNSDSGEINFGNVQLIVYIEQIEEQPIRCLIDGEDVSYYGGFLRNVEIPEGLRTDTDYINVNGTDVNDPFRQNIKGKTIIVEFDVGDCELTASTSTLRQITRLLVNKRDKYNRPIPKRIEFSHYPDVYWEYILEDTLSNEVNISSYEVKANLVITAGTAYAKVTTKTNVTGYVSGLAHIRPTIQFLPSANAVTLTEKVTGQNFQISYNEEWLEKVIEIDCNNRRVYLKEDDDDTTGTDISQYTDFNSDWFTILGEYEFESTGASILSVNYKERW